MKSANKKPGKLDFTGGMEILKVYKLKVGVDKCFKSAIVLDIKRIFFSTWSLVNHQLIPGTVTKYRSSESVCKIYGIFCVPLIRVILRRESAYDKKTYGTKKY